ncbi:GNAT family N-acetyltransferase [Paenibacillus soyae]|uniref:GNAT family N-acetyltransferase n=1 Tax=Paenibacillus soyae TaxID=2969249 RepID=A0A9X2MTP6_9BACL|nr:GNAT family N-acetyltransferase [Paenibacillus soyae]MCR2806634.1 GNAT family N-acetyltransferase [Paenibacillus soyae]
MEITLKETEEGVPLELELYAFSRQEELTAWGFGEQESRAFLAMQFQARQMSYRMQYPNGVRWIILRAGEQAGMVHTENGESEMVIIDLSLLPAMRNQGIGSKVLSMLQDEARGMGKPLRLTVRKDNPALRLYERLSFVPVREDELQVSMVWSS